MVKVLTPIPVRRERAIAKNWASEGQNVREFEDLFARHFGYSYAVAMSSGRPVCSASTLLASNCCASAG